MGMFGGALCSFPLAIRIEREIKMTEVSAESKVRTVTYPVLVKKTEGGFTATVVGFPNCTVEAPSRSEAIRLARGALKSFISEGELVQMEVEVSSPTRSLRDFAGMWADDKTFDEFVEAMNTFRQEADADETTP
jgi:predicted RNase H-like HicB family nuclease